jgi:hypothetical protein
MGHWGVKSYENDHANDALDVGFDRVHPELYDELMDDANPLTFEQVQEKLASPTTLEQAIASVVEAAGSLEAIEAWDELDRLALVGVVVRHAEMRVPIPERWGRLAIEWLEHEEIDWDEATKRRLRIQKELDLLRRALDQPPESTDREAVAV